MNAPRRNRRGEIALCVLASGCFAIAWGRTLARKAGLALRESTQTRDRNEALRIMERRKIEVYTMLGDAKSADRARSQVAPIPIRDLASESLSAWATGILGVIPRRETYKSCAAHLLWRRNCEPTRVV